MYLVLMARSIPTPLTPPPLTSPPKRLPFDFKIVANAPVCEASLRVQMPHGGASA